MFPDHVGGLRAYIYDENGKFLTSQTQARTAAANPFKQDGYHMHFSLPKGKYRVVAVAFQKDYSEALATTGAKFRYAETRRGRRHYQPPLRPRPQRHRRCRRTLRRRCHRTPRHPLDWHERQRTHRQHLPRCAPGTAHRGQGRQRFHARHHLLVRDTKRSTSPSATLHSPPRWTSTTTTSAL